MPINLTINYKTINHKEQKIKKKDENFWNFLEEILKNMFIFAYLPWTNLLSFLGGSLNDAKKPNDSIGSYFSFAQSTSCFSKFNNFLKLMTIIKIEALYFHPLGLMWKFF